MSTVRGAAHTWLDSFTMAVSALVLVSFTALSCYLNEVYAVRGGEDVRYHVALPVLALLAGIFAEVIFMSNVNRAVRWLTGSLVSGGFVAVMAASYLAVAGVALAKYPTFPRPLTYVLAAFPDGFMVIAATVLLALRVRRTRLRGAAAKASDAPKPSRFRVLADAATARAVATLTPTEPPRSPVEYPVEPVETAPVEEVKPAVEPVVVEDRAPAKPAVESPRPAPKPAVEPDLLEFMDAAEEMVRGGVVARKSAVELARVIAAIERGDSDNAIKTSGIASASTAGKVRAALAERETRRELQAV